MSSDFGLGRRRSVRLGIVDSELARYKEQLRRGEGERGTLGGRGGGSLLG